MREKLVVTIQHAQLKGSFHQGAVSIAHMDVGKKRELGAEALR
ncbi:MAG: hypothetical protein ABW168_08410 [Sedimenticola sp.]